MVHQRALDGLALGLGHGAVDGGQMHQQRRHGELRVMEIDRRLGLAEQTGDGLEHGGGPFFGGNRRAVMREPVQHCRPGES